MQNILFAALLCSLTIAPTTLATDPRSINLALETSLLFKPGEDAKFPFINKIRNFIDRIDEAITPVKAFLRSTHVKKDIFPEFLRKITKNIIKYDDADLEEVAKTLKKEVDNLLNSKHVFTDNTRKSIANILLEYSRLHSIQIRSNLQNALDGNEIILTTLADKINNYFNEDDKANLDDIIKKSDKTSNKKLESKWDKIRHGEIKRIVKEFLNILLEKFDALDDVTKRHLRRHIGNVLEFLDSSKIYMSKDKNRVEFKRESTNNDLKDNTYNTNKDVVLNKDIQIFVQSLNAKNGSEKVVKETIPKEDDFNFNDLVNRSVDLSTVLEELIHS